MENSCCICLEVKNNSSKLIYQPCNIKTHKICKDCLSKTLGQIPIGEKNPVVKCQYPFVECQSKKFYKDEIIFKFLKDRFFIYKEAKEKYLHPDYYIKVCGECNTTGYVLKKDIDILNFSRYMCNHCCSINCFTCSEKTNQYNSCDQCYSYNFYNNPVNFNYFFPKPKNKRLYLTDYKFLNKELDSKFLINFISKRFQNEQVYVSCPVCEIPIEKSEDCNSIIHCHVEICNVCGMFSNVGEQLFDHWSSRGLKGCPRWDTDSCIKNDVKNFVCVERQCYGHVEGNCDIKDHTQGVLEYKTYKKKKLMYHFLINIPQEIRTNVMNNLPVALVKYLPEEKNLFIFNTKSCNPHEYKHF